MAGLSEMTTHWRSVAVPGRDLDATSRWALRTWLAEHPALRALYEAKERLLGFYRIRSHYRRWNSSK